MKTEKILTLLRCAETDLIGALQARNQLNIEVHNWDSYQLTIDELNKTIEHLEKTSNDEIAIIWGIQDIYHQADQMGVNIDSNQAIEVLQLLERRHDATIGICWGVIGCVIDMVISHEH